MCVLLFVPSGTPTPSREILKACAKANPDGFGFAAPSLSCKTMDFEELYDALACVPDDEPRIIHFRWATHGSVCPRNCHPFYNPVSGGVFFAHNGVLSLRPQGDMTDSETAFQRCIVPIIRKFGFESREVDAAVGRIIGTSKFALLNGDKVRLFGHFIEAGGVYYSNLNFTRYLRDPYSVYDRNGGYDDLFGQPAGHWTAPWRKTAF